MKRTRRPTLAISRLMSVPQLGVANGQDQTYVRHIVLIVWDHGLQRQTQDAYQAYLSNADARLGKEELEKAKRRKVPKF